MYIRMYVCMYLCVYVCVYACMYVCLVKHCKAACELQAHATPSHAHTYTYACVVKNNTAAVAGACDTVALHW